MNEALFADREAAADFAAALPTRALGKHIEYHRVTGSTNELAALAARSGAPHGLVVVADEQTAGRGRQGRNWSAPPCRGLLFSVVLRPGKLPAPRLGWIALGAGLAAAEAVERATGLRPAIKWPNDIVIPASPWRKLGGVLCESVVAAGSPDGFAVAGIGLNVLQAQAELPTVAKSPPTSILVETGRRVARTELLAQVLGRLERRWLDLHDDDLFAALQARIQEGLEAWWRGKTIRATSGGRGYAGAFAGLDAFGRLRLRLSRGEEVALSDAEIVGVE